MADKSFKEFHPIANAEFLVYCEFETGNERTVVNKGVVGTNLVGTGVAGAYSIRSTIGLTIGSTMGLCGSSNTPPPKKVRLIPLLLTTSQMTYQ